MALPRTVILALLLPAGLAAGQTCPADGGAFTDVQVVSLSVPAGCAVTFKAWGGGGSGSGTYPGAVYSAGGGGGFASVTRVAPVAVTYTLAIGGAGHYDCTRSPGGAGIEGFVGGAGGNPHNGRCAGGGGGGATVIWAGPATGVPLLVAAGGGGGGGAPVPFDGEAGGRGPFGTATAGADGLDGPDGGSTGGGGAGYPLGGLGGAAFGLGGTGGQNFASDGITASGSGTSPGLSGDPARPNLAGRGALNGTWGPVSGAVVYTFGPDTLDLTPDDVAFEPLVDQAPDTVVESAATVLLGFDQPLVAMVRGPGSPELSVDGGEWATEGTVSPGQSVRLRQRTSPAARTSRSAVFLIGTASAEWTVTTASSSDKLAVGCNCAATGSPGVGLLGLALAAARGVRRGGRSRARAARA